MIYLNEDLQRIVQAIRNIKNSDTDSTTNDASPKYLFDDLKDIADAIKSLNPEQTNEILRQTNETPETLNDALDEIIDAIENIEIEHPEGKITITKNGEDIDVAQYATADVNVPQDFTVNESYNISEGTLNTATITLEGDVTAHIPDGVTTLGGDAFANNDDITKVIMPNSVTSIGNSAFSGCTSLTSITIPDSIITISDYMFSHCTSLTSITIPDSVTSIRGGAFDDCTSLTDIYYTGTQEEWEAITKSDARIPAGATIHYEYTPE